MGPLNPNAILKTTTSQDTFDSSSYDDNNSTSTANPSIFPKFSAHVPKRHVNPRTGRVHCLARREPLEQGRLGQLMRHKNSRVVFYLQKASGRGNDLLPLLVAQRRGPGTFHIFDVSLSQSLTDDLQQRPRRWLKTKNHDASYVQLKAPSDDQRHGHWQWLRKHHDACYVGKLGRSRVMQAGFVGNKLIRGTGASKKHVSSVMYDLYTLCNDTTNGAGCVVVSVLHSDEEAVKDRLVEEKRAQAMAAAMNLEPNLNNKNKSAFMYHRPPKKVTSSLGQVLRLHMDHWKDLPNLYQGTCVFGSKNIATMDYHGHSTEPRFASSNNDDWIKQFQGRARLPSEKNVQLVDHSTGQVAFQMGRWNTTDFTVDFHYPYNAYQAFGVALAQLEI